MKKSPKKQIPKNKTPTSTTKTPSPPHPYQATPEHSNPTQYLFLMLQTCLLTSPYLLYARPPARPLQHIVQLQRVSLVQWRSLQTILPRLVSFWRSTCCCSK